MPVPENEILVTAGTTAVVSVAATLTATAAFKWAVTAMKPILKTAWKKLSQKKQGLIGKLKDIGEEKEHTLEVLGTLVRLGVVVWSGFIITMNYIDIPIIKEIWKQRYHFRSQRFYGRVGNVRLDYWQEWQ